MLFSCRRQSGAWLVRASYYSIALWRETKENNPATNNSTPVIAILREDTMRQKALSPVNVVCADSVGPDSLGWFTSSGARSASDSGPQFLHGFIGPAQSENPAGILILAPAAIPWNRRIWRRE